MTTDVPQISVFFQERDAEILRTMHQLGAVTPQHILTVSRTWEAPFPDLHTVRRRLRKLRHAGWTREYPLTAHIPNARHYYRLTRQGFRMIYPESPMPEDTFFRAVADARQRHTFALADVLAHTHAACAAHRVCVMAFRREDEITLDGGGFAASPDHFLQLKNSGMTFNLFLEVDRGTEPVESEGFNSVRRKLAAYEVYQDAALAQWDFRFRVAFLTTSIERVHTILRSALRLAKNRDRLVCYAAPMNSYLAETDPLRTPLFLDHHGRWQALVDIHPTAQFLKTSIRLHAGVTAELPL